MGSRGGSPQKTSLCGDKHTARDPFLVTVVEDSKVTMQKVLHSSHLHKAAPRINSQKLRIDEKFLYAPPASRRPATGGEEKPASREAKPLCYLPSHRRPAGDYS